MFFNFKCIDIGDDDLRVYSDLEVSCWGGWHSVFSFSVAAPAIIVWGLGIPAFAFFIMKRHSKNLEQMEVR